MGRPQAESRTETLRHLHNRVKSFTSQVSDRPRHLRTPAALPSLRHPGRRLRATQIPTTPLRHAPAEPQPRSLAKLALAQVSPVFVRVHATGRRPGSFHIKSSPRSSNPSPAPSHPSRPKFSPRPFSCTPSRPRATTACLNHSPSPLSVTPDKRHKA